MYTGYFGLTEAPFGISPNPRYLYMSEAHREALAHLLYGIDSDGCIILLTGDVGTGKTTLCRCLLEQLPKNTEVAVILNPRLTARELLKTICEEFGLLPDQTTGSIKTYIDALNTHLLKAHANDRNIAIIVDEAQNLAIDVLEQLRLLTNLETPTRKLLRILLLGQPELRDMLERSELSQVNQRITSRFHLGPLQPDDVKAYIQHRLNIAGDHSSSLFSDKAIRHAIKLTGGIPRLINVLCDRALLGAYAINTDHVDLEIMKQAGEELFPNKYKKEHTLRKAAIISGAVIAMLAIPAVVFIPDWLQSPPPAPTLDKEQVATTIPGNPAKTEAKDPTKPEESVKTAGITEQQQPAAEMIEPEAANELTKAAATDEQPMPETNGQIHLEKNLPESLPTPPSAQQVVPPGEKSIVEEGAAPTNPPLPPVTSQQPEIKKQPVETTQPPPPIAEAQPSQMDHLTEQAAQPKETISPPTPPPPTVQKQETTIRVSDPLLVREKAGPHPQQAVQELIAR